MTRNGQRPRWFLWLGAGLLCWPSAPAFAQGVPRAMRRAFDFPASLAHGVVGDLVRPGETASSLRFSKGSVAIGSLPIPLPERVGRRARARLGRDLFLRPPQDGPHVRLLLANVVDGDAAMASRTDNKLVIDVVVTPADAAESPPPFTIPFDIVDGHAFVDARLPITAQEGSEVGVQLRSASVMDADRHVFGVLGFTIPRAYPTPVPRATPTPGEPPSPDGVCFIGSSCAGPSFPATREKCCRFAHADTRPTDLTSWCPPDHFDPATGRCAAEACTSCGPVPPPLTCGERAECHGACQVQCEDGHVAQGVCRGDLICQCSASCTPPTPRATPIPSPPHGRICCQCQRPHAACFELSFAAVEPICPRGCVAVPNGTCDPATNACSPATACTTNADCDDHNACTIDRCTPNGCVHDCVCVGPHGCGPGPMSGPHH